MGVGASAKVSGVSPNPSQLVDVRVTASSITMEKGGKVDVDVDVLPSSSQGLGAEGSPNGTVTIVVADKRFLAQGSLEEVRA